MKSLGALIAIGFMAVSFVGCNACEENALTGIGDKIATIGKKDFERTAVLAERKAERAAKCIEQKAEEAKQKLGL